jgi:hypothetical protein
VKSTVHPDSVFLELATWSIGGGILGAWRAKRAVRMWSCSPSASRTWPETPISHLLVRDMLTLRESDPALAAVEHSVPDGIRPASALIKSDM